MTRHAALEVGLADELAGRPQQHACGAVERAAQPEPAAQPRPPHAARILHARRCGRILHRPDNDLEDELARIGTYSLLKARERIEAGERIGAAGVVLALVKDAVTLYRQEWRNGGRGFVRTALVCCHRCLVNLAIYAERVRRER